MNDHRPQVHLRPQRGWTNDPVGPIRWRGRWHLFHQANPLGGYWHRPHWGHFVSDDLVRWEELPLALSPNPDGPDRDGVYSGCVIAHEDTAWMFYTGASGPVGPDQAQVTCVATSTDDDLRHWTRLPAVVTQPPAGMDLIGFRDPFVLRWGSGWLQLVGAGIAGVGGAVLAFTSDDLVDWEYAGPVLIGDHSSHHPLWTGSMWECPALLRIGEVDLLLISVHDGDDMHHPVVFTGRFDGQRFLPEHGQRVDLGPDLYAPCVLARDATSALLWGWSWEARSEAAQRAAGWAGALSLPRLVSVQGGVPEVRPAAELTGLRAGARSVTLRPAPSQPVPSQPAPSQPVPSQPVPDGLSARLPGLAGVNGGDADGPGWWLADGADGDVLEVVVRLPAQPGRVGVAVRCSPDGSEATVITYDRQTHRLELDRRYASLDESATADAVGGELRLAADEALHLRVYVDRSVIEVFANDRAALTARVYPTRSDSTQVAVLAGSGAEAPDLAGSGSEAPDLAGSGAPWPAVSEIAVYDLHPILDSDERELH